MDLQGDVATLARGWETGEIRRLTPLRSGEGSYSVEQRIVIADVLERIYAGKIAVDRDTLIAGALLADVGKPLEFDRDDAGKLTKGHFGDMLRHPFSGVALSHKHGIPAEVMHMVATHSHEGDKVQRTIESIIFHHAHFIDFDIAKYLGRG